MPARAGKKTSIGGQFAPRLIEMLESPAYRALSLSGHRVLARIEIELGHHGGNDNGRLPVTFDHFHEYGIHRHAIAPAIREAVALGFLAITEIGRSGNGEFRRPNLYRITYRPTLKAGATDDWRKLMAMDEAEAVADAARKNKRPVPVSASFQCRKPHHKLKSPVPETITTGPMPETITTSISREGNLQQQPGERRPPQRPSEPGLPHSGDSGAVVLSLGEVSQALLKSMMVRKDRVPHASRK